MPKTKISEFSSTPANNTDIDSINIAEGCAPSGINDAIRELMSQLKDFQTGAVGDSFNGPVGSTTASTGAFTTLSASSTLSVTGAGSIQGLTVGRGAGAVSTNTAVGASALAAITTGTESTGAGYFSLKTATTAIANTAFGAYSLRDTTGNYNSAFGRYALVQNSTGANNTAVGSDALYSNTTASNNTAVGYQALYDNTTGYENTAVGSVALGNVTTGAFNAGFGRESGQELTTGSNNAFFGTQSGRYVTTGSNNSLIGDNAGSAMTTGTKNTILGRYNGNQGGLDIRTSSNYIVLSDGDGNPRGIFDGSGNLLVGTTSATGKITVSTSGNTYGIYSENSNTATTSNYLFWGYASSASRFVVYGNGGIANYQANNVNLSDRREKTNFAPAKSYLDVICAIPVQTFNFIDQAENDVGLTLGVIAQDVQAVAPELVTENNWGTEEEPKMRLSIYQTDLQYALMKALQELKAEFDAYKASHP